MKQTEKPPHESRISPYEVNEGQEVILEWSPYEWAKEEIGVKTPVKGKIVRIDGTQKENHMCDIVVSIEGFEGGNLTVYTDNGYVTTGVGGSPFDKGRFGGFYEL